MRGLTKLHVEGTTYNTEHRTYIRKDIPTTRLNQPRGRFIENPANGRHSISRRDWRDFLEYIPLVPAGQLKHIYFVCSFWYWISESIFIKLPSLLMTIKSFSTSEACPHGTPKIFVSGFSDLKQSITCIICSGIYVRLPNKLYALNLLAS